LTIHVRNWQKPVGFVLSNPHWDMARFEEQEKNEGEPPYWQPPYRYVYIARARDGHLLKIGLTVSLRQRLATLKAEPIVVFRVPYWGAHPLEQHLHRRFAEARVDGEWFSPTAKLVAFVADCLSGNQHPIEVSSSRTDTTYRAEVVV
jgi:hypothetical protein